MVSYLRWASSANGASERRIAMIKQDDVVTFSYDASKMNLHLAINGVQQGVIFEAVPARLHPVVVLYGERKSVRLLRVSKSDITKHRDSDRAQYSGTETALNIRDNVKGPSLNTVKPMASLTCILFCVK